jgi:signal transduction histidine kinase
MGSLDYESTLTTVAGLALPDLGGWSIVDVIDPPNVIRRLAVVHPDPEKQRLARLLKDGWPPEKEDPIGAPVVMRTGQPQVVPQVTDEMLVKFARSDENLAVLRALGIGSFLVVPLIARGEAIGAITFVSPDAGHPYDGRSLEIAEELAAMSALVIHNARLHRDIELARNRADQRAEEAERQQRDVERIMELQARLVRGFSHDVKNPLGAAIGYAELLETGVMDTLTSKQMGSMKRIGASIRTAVGLMDDLVAYASSKMGKLEVRLGPTDVRELVLEMVDEYRAQVEAAGLDLQVYAPELPLIQSDKIRIRQIIGNLLSNAVKYTEEGRVTVRAEFVRDGEPTLPGECIAVHVTDTGVGIPLEKQHLLFQEFARLEPAATQGVGLGLAISRLVANALGARITLTSAEGQGSTFSLWLSLTPKQWGPPADA